MKVVGYQYYGKPYVVGEAPGPRPGVPLEAARKRLAGLCGVSPSVLADRMEWVNLLAAWPGYGPSGGSTFPMDAAREAAARLSEVRPLILLGKRVAKAFGVEQPWFWWVDNIAVVPHPSGLNRWWNDPQNTARATEFWKLVIA